MKKPAKRVLLISAVAGVFLAMVFGFYLWKAALVVTGFEAKNLCSDVFVSGRTPAAVSSEDLLPVGALYPLRFANGRIDYGKRTVTASIHGLAERKAIFRQGLGCTLMIGGGKSIDWSAEGATVAARDAHGRENEPWPRGEMVDTKHLPHVLDGQKLRQAVDWAFREPDPDHLRGTRELVVVYDGRIVAERYAPGFSSHTPLPGWSMTKSVFAALAGILVGEGKLSLQSDALLPEWCKAHDPRKKITLNDLLHMCSGLAFQENYSSPLSDVSAMMFGTGDMASFAANKPLLFRPGVKWQYSSGTPNIVSEVMRNVFGNEREYIEFPRRELFERIDMKSAVVEPDASGTLVGSAFMYATARDWARFGLLYMRDGMWGKDRILPEGWVKYCTAPAPASGKRYGAGFWLRIPREFRSGGKTVRAVPRGSYHAIGYDGQFVSVIPSLKLVVVRLGLTTTYGTWDQEELISRIAGAVRSQGVESEPHS
ncbi:MAG: serine hydrolase [Syntrophobacteraceae bacterium]|nr:serine hydrolase [Syntrophobacteraceae bacterium]